MARGELRDDFGERVEETKVIDSGRTRIEGGRRKKEVHGSVPLVSVISVIFRAARDLTPLLESICANRGVETEVIVIDGGSNDGTIDILRAFDHCIDYWVSEQDGGIYDAMNKGLAAATGEFVLHVNAGDRLRYIPVQALRKCLADGIDAACFGVNVAGWGDYPPRSGFRLHIENSLHHQGVFYRRKTHPGYDLQYRVFSDFDCNQRLLKSGGQIALFRDIVADQITIGVSGSGRADRELYQIVRTNFGAHYAALAFLWRRLSGVRVAIKALLKWPNP